MVRSPWGETGAVRAGPGREASHGERGAILARPSQHHPGGQPQRAFRSNDRPKIAGARGGLADTESAVRDEAHRGKLALFMAVDNVKFRKLVEPGDQLYLEVEIIRERSRTASVRGQAKVAGEIVAEADIVFSFTDASFLD